jgi:cyclophilin family peptidyl-prolyl cis-trans isomerase
MLRYLLSLTMVVALAACDEPQESGGAGGAKPAQGSDKPPEPPAASDDVALKACDAFIAEQKIDKTKDRWKTMLPEPPKLTFDEKSAYFWVIETNMGNIKVKLMPKVAPMHVSSTIYLSRLGFYDGLLFHRVIPQFMAQGGCPLGTGTGGPGYKYAGEFDPAVRHDKPGLLSMANAGPGTDGSQFFLTFVPTPHLNGKHTIFGEVVEGMDTLKELEKRGSSPSGRTSEKLFMKKTTIEVKKG